MLLRSIVSCTCSYIGAYWPWLLLSEAWIWISCGPSFYQPLLLLRCTYDLPSLSIPHLGSSSAGFSSAAAKMVTLPYLVLPFALHFSTTSAAPTKRLSTTAVITADFPDPALIQVRGGWYSFGTTNGKNNVQIARSRNFDNWAVLEKDALPRLPAWASGPVWAPDVAQRVGRNDQKLYNMLTILRTTAHL